MSADIHDIPELGDEQDAEGGYGSELEIGGRASRPAANVPVERPDPIIRGKVDKFGVAWGTGRRKTAVARVRITDGDGTFTVNGRPIAEYFPFERDQQMVFAVLKATDMVGKVQVTATVSGGGPTGQAGAMVLGVARALQAKNPSLHYTLSDGGFLTRDGRMVERKKYGFKKARRSFQFSKR
jgi:small subunit ribosomal protein S9